MATQRWLNLITIAGLAALVSGSYYVYINNDRSWSLKAASQLKIKSASQAKIANLDIGQLPDIMPTYHVDGPTRLNFHLTLFQYSSCPYCRKTRAFLDYFGLKYDIVEVDPVFRRKLAWSSYKKVPILLVHGDTNDATHTTKVYQINDSSVIISSIASYLLTKRTSTDSRSRGIEDFANILVNYEARKSEDGRKTDEIPNRYFLMLANLGNLELDRQERNLSEERQWRDWTDRVLVHSLAPNIYRTLPESFQAIKILLTMGQWDRYLTSIQRGPAIYLGATMMWLYAKKLKRTYNLKRDVRKSLYENCRLWLEAIGPGRRFMGGQKPNLADLSVFGVLSSIEGCIAFDDLMFHTSIGPWYQAVKESCKNHQGMPIQSF